jgi:predicted transcriptional regulator
MNHFTPIEYSVLKALDTRRWKTILQIANELQMATIAVAQALHYLNLNGRVERQQRQDIIRWRLK